MTACQLMRLRARKRHKAPYFNVWAGRRFYEKVTDFVDPTNSFHGLIPRGYYRIQKIINTNSFHGLIPRRYYRIQKIINTNGFYGDKKIQGKPENRELSSPCQPVLFYIWAGRTMIVPYHRVFPVYVYREVTGTNRYTCWCGVPGVSRCRW